MFQRLLVSWPTLCIEDNLNPILFGVLSNKVLSFISSSSLSHVQSWMLG